MAYTKPLQAGDLDRKITIIQWDTHKDTMGEIGRSQSPLVSGLPAKKRDVTGKGDGVEKPVADRETAFGLAEFTIRYRNDLDKTMQIVCEGITYDIKSISEGETRRQWTIITAQTHD